MNDLKRQSDIELFRELFNQLTRKQEKAVLESARKRIILDDVLKSMIGN